MVRNCLLILAFICLSSPLFAQSQLSVEYIMRDPQWMGTFPSRARWSDDSQIIYFQYNPEKNPADSTYKIQVSSPKQIQKVNWKEESAMRRDQANWNTDYSQRVYLSASDQISLENMKTGQKKVLLNWHSRVSNPTFLADENLISFVSDQNIFTLNLSTGVVKKVTQISSGSKPSKKSNAAQAEQVKGFVETENLELLQVVKERQEAEKKRAAYREATREQAEEKFVYYTEGKSPANLQLSPDGNFASFTYYNSSSNKNTKVPDYVAASGYTEDLNARPKVGTDPTTSEIGIYDLKRDSVYFIDYSKLPGLQDLPDYTKDYPDKKWDSTNRKLSLFGPIFSPDGKRAIVQARSFDNKDRWIAEVNLQTGELKNLDRQRDEAWIAGPGIGWTFSGGTLGWLPDSKHIYFQSEESGYSHLYLLNVENGNKKTLTSGAYEVFDPFISRDKKSWFFTSSEVDPGERHFYQMPLMGGKKVQLTSMTGNNEVSLSPDQSKMAIIHSYSNRPEELYIQDLKPGAKPVQITNGQSEEFKAYNWRDPEIIRFQAEDGAMVPARIYQPEASKKNGAAVIFVHGAGYLQNVHKWWSSYFREYMFHNLLTDLGYTVLDIDYRASSGYGRDWRTGIYRHMGGKDLSDQVDGAKHLVEKYGVDADRIGIYGGSYGGFITLMALFTAPEVFKSGAALRSVTDWAHYNHGYTSNILNTPEEDPIAYRRSSPIYFAEGLKGNLLMAHGMVDVNVHFQDVVRLSQRLIELGKDNWEMAIYPVEDHGFVEPSSWTDEYKRILKLFNNTLLND
ncbi:MAG TPA: S9 family peptidase [Algoriphagus sp.]|jgi:dipeptidyl aminopeptidase/acylaminoacyl peptidase|uniref:S9 family peptidase n=2 Tax=Algoriphagus TaxID=246875 RepID=UPI000C5B9054|nr:MULTISPECIES: prolyl oligopeptidase family serine peptidase [unclassified Algoriphagus]MAL13235.1 S9 family peptidase [Algoriphagus sp.]MAN88254.1 S9 family peptidase [Algoriphagus sp.]QYH38384.1 S9 family peptidase [Algoriphagus sp. NBT04N3]HCD88194.1 S9 family peptidase [Algoriphagus sp.]